MYINIQETQLVKLEDINVLGCWGNSNFGFDGVRSHIMSGRSLSPWDNTLFQCSEIIKSRSFLITIGNWSGMSDKIAFENIYGPQSVTDKDKLWQVLLKIKHEKPGMWIHMGDFNVVR